MKHFLAHRIHVDQRKAEGVGDGAGQSGSVAEEGRSLLANYHVAVEPTQGGGSTTPA
jgi:hypothetical protein